MGLFYNKLAVCPGHYVRLHIHVLIDHTCPTLYQVIKVFTFAQKFSLPSSAKVCNVHKETMMDDDT